MKPSALAKEGKEWAMRAKAKSSRSCETCAWLKTSPRGADFHRGVIEALRDGANPPIAQVHARLWKAYGLRIQYGGFRNHWRHTIEDVGRG